VRRKGRLLVFEGVDNAGKTTLSTMLVEWLRQRGEDAVHFSFPGREPRTLGSHVYSLHHEPERFEVEALHPASRQIMHIAAHVEAIETQILPALAQGRQVILDRFWWSTFAYGLASGVGKRALSLLIKAEAEFWGNTKPEVLFYLTRDTANPGRRLSAAYENLCRHPLSDFPIQRIENNGSLEKAFDLICQKLVVPEKEYRATEADKRSNNQIPFVFTRLSPAKPTIVYDTYWQFAAERQAIFFRRFHGEPEPWTDDPILRQHKFTNAYRASDRVSQFLIKHVIYAGDQSVREVGFRTLLFKLFNKIETWQLLCHHVGEIRADEFSFRRYDAILSKASDEGQTLYSGAYIMPSGGPGNPGSKHKMHLRLLERLLRENVFERIADMKKMREGFDFLRTYPSFGDFLAYQYITDINYSNATDFSEREFVVPGPGARDGIKKCFADLGGLSEPDMIRLVADRQNEEFIRLGIPFQDLWGRELQYIDCQNLFCEVDKYSRVKHPDIAGLSGRTRIKQKFRYRPLGRLTYFYPPKWGINESIEQPNHVSEL